MIKDLTDGRCRVSLYFPGGRQFKRVYPDRKTGEGIFHKLKAAIKLDRVREALEEIDGAKRDVVLVKDLLEMYKRDYCEMVNRSMRTKKSRIKLLLESKAHLARIPVNSLIVGDVTRHAAGRRKAGKSNVTINREVSVLVHALNWGVQQGYLRDNPLRHWKKLPEPKRPVPEALEEAIAATFAKLPDEVLPLYTFIAETGCRREEALSLTHDQVDLDEGVVTLPRTKSGQTRYLGLTEGAIAAIKAMPRASSYVFYHPRSLTRWCDCKDPWIAAREAAKCKWLKVKDLRTAFAMRLAETPGIEKHVIQSLLGHSNLATTERFYALHSAKKAVKRGLRLVEKARKKAS